MVAVRLFFRWTAQENIYHDIADHIKGATVQPGHARDYLTSDQARSVLGVIDCFDICGMRDYAIVALMLTTGLRTISIVRADIGDMRTVADSTVLYYQGKGRDDKAEYVKLANPVEAAIRIYLKQRGKTADSEPLFISHSRQNAGSRLTTRTVSGAAKAAMRAVGLDSDRLTAHSLRHTAATLNLLNGGSLLETQQLMGHTDISTTMIYSLALERADNNSELRIADVISTSSDVRKRATPHLLHISS